jgi:hypothetical protein
MCSVFAIVAFASVAEAYPQFQFSTGNTRCADCHYTPSGGGLLNGWGRSESADSISTWGGNGQFLYGAYDEPEWMQLGFDFRSAAIYKDQAADPEFLAFPMQGDFYARFAMGEKWSIYSALGPRAQARESGGALDALKRYSARELFAMWRDTSSGWYARAGRFLTPFGLRSQDHTWYTRRDVGLYAWDETFTLNGGRVQDKREWHVSAFAPIPTILQSGGQGDFGVSALHEWRLGDGEHTAVAAQTRFAINDEHTRTLLGGYAKHWMPDYNLLLMAEIDGGLETFSASPGPSRAQVITYAGLSYFPVPGLLATLAHERYDEDLSIKATARDAFSGAMQFFPMSKLEVMGTLKLERFGVNRRTGRLLMLQLHYYL